MFSIVITEPAGRVAGKLADAEVQFTAGPLAGLRLIGFGIWAARSGGFNVTLPSRTYAVNGERRSYALLRPAADATDTRTATEGIRAAILAAFEAYSMGAQPSPASGGTYNRSAPGAQSLNLAAQLPVRHTTTRSHQPTRPVADQSPSTVTVDF